VAPHTPKESRSDLVFRSNPVHPSSAHVDTEHVLMMVVGEDVTLGSKVGLDVGDKEGRMVGSNVGREVGEALGTDVGKDDTLGESVGMSANEIPTMRKIWYKYK
jgi:hypothetical protein